MTSFVAVEERSGGDTGFDEWAPGIADLVAAHVVDSLNYIEWRPAESDSFDQSSEASSDDDECSDSATGVVGSGGLKAAGAGVYLDSNSDSSDSEAALGFGGLFGDDALNDGINTTTSSTTTVNNNNEKRRSRRQRAPQPAKPAATNAKKKNKVGRKGKRSSGTIGSSSRTTRASAAGGHKMFLDDTEAYESVNLADLDRSSGVSSHRSSTSRFGGEASGVRQQQLQQQQQKQKKNAYDRESSRSGGQLGSGAGGAGFRGGKASVSLRREGNYALEDDDEGDCEEEFMGSLGSSYTASGYDGYAVQSPPPPPPPAPAPVIANGRTSHYKSTIGVDAPSMIAEAKRRRAAVKRGGGVSDAGGGGFLGGLFGSAPTSAAISEAFEMAPVREPEPELAADYDSLGGSVRGKKMPPGDSNYSGQQVYGSRDSGAGVYYNSPAQPAVVSRSAVAAPSGARARGRPKRDQLAADRITRV